MSTNRHTATTPESNLIPLKNWVRAMGISSPTAWRWRKAGMFTTINIRGKLYVTKEIIAEFETKAAAGAFHQDSVTPKR